MNRYESNETIESFLNASTFILFRKLSIKHMWHFWRYFRNNFKVLNRKCRHGSNCVDVRLLHFHLWKSLAGIMILIGVTLVNERQNTKVLVKTIKGMRCERQNNGNKIYSSYKITNFNQTYIKIKSAVNTKYYTLKQYIKRQLLQCKKIEQ